MQKSLILIILKRKTGINSPQILDHPYTILTVGGSEPKKNTLLNLVSHQSDIDRIYSHAKDPSDSKVQK